MAAAPVENVDANELLVDSNVELAAAIPAVKVVLVVLRFLDCFAFGSQ
jgi:hypothetical protein